MSARKDTFALYFVNAESKFGLIKHLAFLVSTYRTEPLFYQLPSRSEKQKICQNVEKGSSMNDATLLGGRGFNLDKGHTTLFLKVYGSCVTEEVEGVKKDKFCVTSFMDITNR